MTVSAIVAMARNHVIGRDNALIWHLPEDLKHFKTTTMGKPLVMGRKSFESLGSKPLPGRPHIVISRRSAQDNPFPDQVFYVLTIEAGLALAKEKACALETDEIFITGGGEIYKQTLPLVERLYLTVLDRDYKGDTVFPAFDPAEWTMLSEKAFPADPAKDRPSFTVYVLARKSP